MAFMAWTCLRGRGRIPQGCGGCGGRRFGGAGCDEVAPDGVPAGCEDEEAVVAHHAIAVRVMVE